jgi:hypothetical protein
MSVAEADLAIAPAQAEVARSVIFISKATPGDDEFVLWLAPRLEAAGYRVFADILSIEPGDRWRRKITGTLQNKAVKMLLCCRDATLAASGVQEEIGTAEDLAKELKDPKFIIPLRLDNFRKVFGIGELQYIDFVRGWADGLAKLLAALKRQNIPHDAANAQINPNWEAYRRRNAVPVEQEPERLTSNWTRIIEVPDTIRYYEPTGAVDRFAMYQACAAAEYVAEAHNRGFFSFGTTDEVNEQFSNIGRFALLHEVDLIKFMQEGLDKLDLRGREASNLVHSMFRRAWNTMCRRRGLIEFAYSKHVGFHISKDQLEIGKKVPWGKQGDRRSSMLRNTARGYVWQFGVSAIPSFWPFPHFRLKSRVLFAEKAGNEAGDVIDDKKKQHRLRRSVCKGWRNKQWHGRMMAFMELLSQDLSALSLPLAATARIRVDAVPILFTSPVSTKLPNEMEDEQEEEDSSTLNTRAPDPEDEI